MCHLEQSNLMVDNQQDDIVLVDALKLGAFGWMKKPLAARWEWLERKLTWSIWHCAGIVVSLDEAYDTEPSKTSSYLYSTPQADPCLTFPLWPYEKMSKLRATIGRNCWVPLSESFWQAYVELWPYFECNIPGQPRTTQDNPGNCKIYDGHGVASWEPTMHIKTGKKMRPCFAISIEQLQGKSSLYLDQVPDHERSNTLL